MQRVSNRASIQTKQAQARKPAGSQGRKIKISFFRGKQCKGNKMLFVTEFSQKRRSPIRQLFTK